MSWVDGFASSFGDLGNAFKHLFTGHGEQAQQNVEQAQQNVQDNIERNGGSYSVLDSVGLAGIKDSIDWVIVGLFGLLIYLFVFKE